MSSSHPPAPSEPVARIPYTEADLKAFSPNLKAYYRDVLLSEEGEAILMAAGILDNARRWCHFMGQFGAETGGGNILRESLNYTSAERIRQVWPARAAGAVSGKDPDYWEHRSADLGKLVRNPVALADWAYGGRMGNGRGTIAAPHRDGYDFRGGGWIQTTGRYAVETYLQRLGLPAKLAAGALDDPLLTLRFACLEWQEAGCNAFADADDLVRISKAINVGNPNSPVTPNGMEDRRDWFAKAKRVWWEREPEAVPVSAEPPRFIAMSSPVGDSRPADEEDEAPPPAGIAQAAGNQPEVSDKVSPAAPVKGDIAKPGVVRTVRSSKSLMGILVAAGLNAVEHFTTWLHDAWEFIAWGVGLIPEMTQDVRTTLTSSEEVSTWLKIDWGSVVKWVTIAAIAIFFIRHLADKRELEAKRAEGGPEAGSA